MAAAEKELWWYSALHHQAINALERSAVSKNAAILDAGCGTGGLLEALYAAGYQNISGIDLSENAIRFCQQKQLPVTQQDIRNIGEHFPPASFDAIISNDVLCYLNHAEQEKVMESFARLLKEQGLLIMNLPAMKAFKGMHDQSVGLLQRFEATDLARISTTKNLVLLQKRHWPFLLSPLIYFIRLNQRWKMKWIKNTTIRSDVSVPVRPVNKLLLIVTMLELRMFSSPAFGSSLFTLFQKKTT
jgi:SAM-dependent methyltransferase